jgi:hypothetical protein
MGFLFMVGASIVNLNVASLQAVPACQSAEVRFSLRAEWQGPVKSLPPAVSRKTVLRQVARHRSAKSVIPEPLRGFNRWLREEMRSRGHFGYGFVYNSRV